MAAEGPVTGTPPVPDAVAGWLETWLHPDYWTDWVSDLVEDGHFNVPWPTDPIRPELFFVDAPVADDDGYVSALPVDHVDLSDFHYEFDGETKTMRQFLRTTRTDVVVFVHDGTVVGEWYANGYSPEIRHQPWSITKTFVAAVVGIAFHDGLFPSLHDPVEVHLPDLAGTAWEGVTIENLLQMETGVHWDEETPVLALNTQWQQWFQIGFDLYSDGAIGQTRNEYIASLPSAGDEPGTVFHYNSAATQVLAWLLETLHDKPFNQILSEQLWIPMGAEGDAVMTSDRVGDVIASHGLFARPHDFARFGELLRHRGRTPEGHQVVPSAWVDAMITMTDDSEGWYGYQTWATRTAGDDAYSAWGFEGQQITVVPSGCLTAVRLSHALGADGWGGDDPLDPDAWSFTIEDNSEEWFTVVAAMDAELGGCRATGQVEGGVPTPLAAPADKAPLPATGGGSLIGLLSALMLAARRRRMA